MSQPKPTLESITAQLSQLHTNDQIIMTKLDTVTTVVATPNLNSILKVIKSLQMTMLARTKSPNA